MKERELNKKYLKGLGKLLIIIVIMLGGIIVVAMTLESIFQ